MMHLSTPSRVRSFAIASMLAAVLLAILIIGGEEMPDLKNWLKATFTHHWLGKCALSLMLFVLAGILFQTKGTTTKTLTRVIAIEAIVVALCAGAVIGFFFLHFLGIKI